MNKKLSLLIVALIMTGAAVQVFGAIINNDESETVNEESVGQVLSINQKGGSVENVSNATGNISLQWLTTYQSANYVADGIGLRNTGRGTINLRVPEGAIPMYAWLYWTILRPVSNLHDTEITVNGIRVVGKVIGSGPDPCWNQTIGRTYKADVLSALQQTDFNVRGGAYGITIGGVSTGLTTGKDPWVTSISPLADNAAIVLVYSTGNSTNWVKIYDGYYEQSGGLAKTSIPAGALKYTSITADGQVIGITPPYTKYVNFNMFPLQKVTLNGVDPSITSSGTINGSLSDSDTFILPYAAISGNLLNYNLANDCIVWNALVYSNIAT